MRNYFKKFKAMDYLTVEQGVEYIRKEGIEKYIALMDNIKNHNIRRSNLLLDCITWLMIIFIAISIFLPLIMIGISNE
jgi:hypothetical protein